MTALDYGCKRPRIEGGVTAAGAALLYEASDILPPNWVVIEGLFPCGSNEK